MMDQCLYQENKILKINVFLLNKQPHQNHLEAQQKYLHVFQ